MAAPEVRRPMLSRTQYDKGLRIGIESGSELLSGARGKRIGVRVDLSSLALRESQVELPKQGVLTNNVIEAAVQRVADRFQSEFVEGLLNSGGVTSIESEWFPGYTHVIGVANSPEESNVRWVGALVEKVADKEGDSGDSFVDFMQGEQQQEEAARKALGVEHVMKVGEVSFPIGTVLYEFLEETDEWIPQTRNLVAYVAAFDKGSQEEAKGAIIESNEPIE